ncbi:MAG TPA: ABC transporter permease [Anaerolineales bacterium]|nr:ABC transporter permease [Anaerolineales bacterium]
MFQEIAYQLRVVWACAKKDFRAALTDRLFTILSLFVPVNVLILMSLFVLAGANAPTAVVMGDQGPYAQAFYQAMSQAHSFRLQIASAAEAERLITAGQIVAVVTVPADFDAKVQQNQPVQVGVKINNLNTDFTNDIRRAIPLSITSFYAKAFPNLVNVSVQEHDLYAHDTGYVPYLGVSILVIALMMGGLLQSGTAAAKEWENQTIKELLLSPASRWAITVGKMLGSFIVSLGSTVIVLLVLIVFVGVVPINWGEMFGFTLLSLVIFNTAGTLLGTVIKIRQPVIALSMGISLPLFFLSGAFAPISFTTPLLQVIARIFPIYYQIVVLQHAFHGFALNTLSLGGNTLILIGYALVLIILVTVALQRTSVSH